VVTEQPLPERTGESRLRASDADREAVVELLRRAHAEGRLDLTEFDERTRSAYAARTYAELATLTSDLPASAPMPQTRPEVPTPARPHSVTFWRVVGSAWFFASFVNLVIWAIVSVATADLVYPWWIWVAGPWGAVLLARWLGERARGER
jgi:hypothetical protein